LREIPDVHHVVECFVQQGDIEVPGVDVMVVVLGELEDGGDVHFVLLILGES
jgi:hypothetical protein